MTAGMAISGITRNLVFSTRRTDRAVNADNLAVSLGNADIASGQVKNALESAELLAKESKNGIFTGFKGANEALKALSKENVILDGAGKVIGFTADHINPIITVVGGIKVLSSDDKEAALRKEALSLGMMFAAEGIAKNILEMEKKVKDPISGKVKIIKRTACYKSNPFLKAQSDKMEKAITDYCATKKLFNKISLKPAPGIGKGLLFVAASIGGYALGNALDEKIANNCKNKDNETCKKIAMVPSNKETKITSKAA